MIKIKKFVSILLVFCFLLSLSSCKENINEEQQITKLSEEQLIKIKKSERRAVWLSYYEISDIFKLNNDEKSFEKEISKRFKELKDFGFNCVIVHCRAFSDAIYNSSIFPTAEYITGEQGGELPFDLLCVMIKCAKTNNLKIEAWINPYRISHSNDITKLSNKNPAKKWLTDDDNQNDNWVFTLDNGLYYNPAIKEVQKLIVDGIKEIVENYDVDGIHFDDYFYPTILPEIDSAEYGNYAENGGDLPLAEWRCNNVNNMIRSAYSAIKKTNKNLILGISPSASINENFNQKYADIKLWVTENGYIDYICPQIYFGFNNEVMPFVSTVKSWQSIMKNSNVKLYFGLGLYKSGQIDEFADLTDGSDNQSPKYEFVNNKNIISRQINYLRQTVRYNGFFIYSYSYLFSNNENIKSEIELIKSIVN